MQALHWTSKHLRIGDDIYVRRDKHAPTIEFVLCLIRYTNSHTTLYDFDLQFKKCWNYQETNNHATGTLQSFDI